MRAPAPQAFASLSDQASRPEARPIYVQAAEPHRRYGKHTGTVADSHKRRHERDDARASEGEWDIERQRKRKGQREQARARDRDISK